MFRKIKNIFGYIWPILHHFLIEKYWDPKKSSSTANMIPADWVAETEKGKIFVKLEGISSTMT